jgi:Class III cytochrome C family
LLKRNASPRWGFPARDAGPGRFAAVIAVAAMIVLALGHTLLAQSEDPAVSGQPKQVQAVAPVQPIPYSHKKHLALGLKCEFCHSNPAPGFLMTFPATMKCMTCHSEVARERPSIQKLAEYDKSKQPVPWVRVYAVPAWVYWNHRLHLEAGIKCETCHGHVAEMETMKMVTDVTTMQGCVDCHEQRGAPAGCQTCHENVGTQ